MDAPAAPGRGLAETALGAGRGPSLEGPGASEGRAHAYGRVTPALLERLRGIVGEANVKADAETLDVYSHDETEDLRFPPEVVVKPGSTAEVAEVLELADRDLVPVTPCGARSGLSGGSLCILGGISLSLERMSRILDIDEKGFFAVVEPGVVTGVLQEEVERRGLFYPPDPSSRPYCTIGGNIAENAGGPRAVKYGVTEEWVRGLELVLPSGEVVRTGGKRLKDVTGYNLVKTIVGSEGTLAVVTEATLRLIALPPLRRTLFVPYASIEAATETVPAVFHARIHPSAIEFMERAAVEAADAKLGTKTTRPVGAEGALPEAYLLIEVDGNDEQALSREVERVGEVALEKGALDVWVAEDEARSRAIWSVRRAMGEAVKKLSMYREEDTVVPRTRLPELVRGVREIVGRNGLRAICYGHAGDGNIHVNVLKMDMDPARWRALSPAVSREIFSLVISLGGTISGEHGIGWIQKPNLPLALSGATIALHRRLKEAFDPHYILNPGKIFDR
jgi:glycolate oxidase